MKNNILTLLSVIILIGMPGIANMAIAQNFYIEVIDAGNYRPIDNARVELKADETNLVFFTNPGGRITNHVPIATYTIIVSHRLYETETTEGFRVRPHELNSLTVEMKRKPIDSDPTRTPEPDTPTEPATTPAEEPREVTETKEKEETARTPRIRRPEISYDRPTRKMFVDLSVHGLNYRAFQISAGRTLIYDIFSSVSLTISKQDYKSDFFINPVETYDVLFIKLAVGGGYNYTYPLSNQMGLFATPSVSIGLEVVNNDFIDNQTDNISFLMIAELKPELKLGFYYEMFGAYIGFDYSGNISSPFAQNFKVIHNGETGEAIKWGDDLFRKRKGIGFTTGIVLNF